jgi:hypothetical protein
MFGTPKVCFAARLASASQVTFRRASYTVRPPSRAISGDALRRQLRVLVRRLPGEGSLPACGGQLRCDLRQGSGSPFRRHLAQDQGIEAIEDEALSDRSPLDEAGVLTRCSYLFAWRLSAQRCGSRHTDCRTKHTQQNPPRQPHRCPPGVADAATVNLRSTIAQLTPARQLSKTS